MNWDEDRIERQVEIAAPAERVWKLISRPGWFINDGGIIDHEFEQRGDVTVLRDPVHGEFPVQTVRLDPPRYAAFRWLSVEERGEMPDGSTLVEFWIDDSGAGVTLRMAESGFASLSVSEEARRKAIEDNTEGWEIELDLARVYLDPMSVMRSIHVPVEPDRLWPIVSEAGSFARWYAFDGAEFDTVPGSPMTLHWSEHGTFHGQVVTVDEPSTFAFRIAAEPDAEPTDTTSTLVTLQLKASGGGSLLTVTQSGFAELDPRLGVPHELAATEADGWEGGLAALAAQVRSAESAPTQ